MTEMATKWTKGNQLINLSNVGRNADLAEADGVCRTTRILQADQPFPSSGEFYFEVKKKTPYDKIFVGCIDKREFFTEAVSFWGYLFGNQKNINQYKEQKTLGWNGTPSTSFQTPPYPWPYGSFTTFESTHDDVIGCGVNMDESYCYFTKNGSFDKRIALSRNMDPYLPLYPTVIWQQGGKGSIETNFGQESFVYKVGKQAKKVTRPTITFADDWMKRMHNSMIGSDSVTPDEPFCSYLNDIKIISKDGHEIGCHRLILSVRSDVFKSMFEPNKNTGSTIQIEEFDMSTIRKMIRFIYADEIDNPDEEIDIDLLNIADKYNIDALRDLCEKTLSQKLEIDNVLEAWKSSDFLKSRCLLQACETFIDKYWKQIRQHETFHRMQKEDSEKLSVLMTKLFDKNKGFGEIENDETSDKKEKKKTKKRLKKG